MSKKIQQNMIPILTILFTIVLRSFLILWVLKYKKNIEGKIRFINLLFINSGKKNPLNIYFI